MKRSSAPAAPPASALRVAIAGAGTIGSGLVALLRELSAPIAARAGKPLVIVAIADPDPSRREALAADGIAWHEDARGMVRDVPADVLVELIGGADGPARECVLSALGRGMHVVTANKAMIAHHGEALYRQARSNRVALRFEAAVAGGIPIIKTLREGLVASRLESIRGILNGTCNYILSTMRRSGDDFHVIVEQAQKLGYAEADPGFDIDGIDAAHKLAILSSLAWGVQVDFAAVHVEGIRSIRYEDIRWGEELGYRLKPLAIAQGTADGIVQRVHPCFIGADDPLAGVEGVFNAVHLAGGAIGSLTLEGPGAGARPTAGAVIADLVDIARGDILEPPPPETKAKVGRWDRRRGLYYLRIDAVDRAGVIAEISAILGKRDISVKTIRQIPASRRQDSTVPIIITTHACVEKDLRQALKAITALRHVGSAPVMIRIEEQLPSR